MKLLHTADLQLGARFSQFGDKAELLREARLKTLERLLNLASEQAVDAFVVAGDLFDDNQVGNELVDKVLALFGIHASVPVFILPGNHDPYTGPGCVWEREAFQNAGDHVHVFRDAEAVAVGDGYLLASPLCQKLSTTDPSLKLDELAKELDSGAIKIGITHGSLDIPGKRQDNDFPINIGAATRGNLNYLAIGHWHGWMTQDDDKIVMPGTPEPDDFSQANSGSVAVVEFDSSGQPKVTRTPVASLTWKQVEFDFRNEEESRKQLQDELSALGGNPESAVFRITLTGRADPASVNSVREFVEAESDGFAVTQIRDNTSPIITEAVLADLTGRSPLLAQVFADLDRIESMVIPGHPGSDDGPCQSDLTLPILQQIVDSARIEVGELTGEHLREARQLILQTLQEQDQ